ncbi:hypothetical protein P8452_00991 [Trifolium repens]|nr:hypothetical protein P8452_00991 [Trifolium repens]
MQNLLWISPKIDLQVEGIGRLLEHGSIVVLQVCNAYQKTSGYRERWLEVLMEMEVWLYVSFCYKSLGSK